MTGAPALTFTDDRVTIAGRGYTLSWATGERGLIRSPYLHLSDADGQRWMRLCALSSVHTVQGRDETLTITEPAVVQEDGDVVVRIETTSSHWRTRVLEVRCTAETVELSLHAVG